MINIKKQNLWIKKHSDKWMNGDEDDIISQRLSDVIVFERERERERRVRMMCESNGSEWKDINKRELKHAMVDEQVGVNLLN